MLNDWLAALSLGDIASTITAIGVIFALTKKGRSYIIAPAIDKIDEIENELIENKKHRLRIEILMLIKDYPQNIQVIEDVYASYKACGGNFYVDTLVGEWKKKYVDSNNKEEKS